MEINKIQSNKRFSDILDISIGKKNFRIDDLKRDYMSILCNSIVRRLQDKTQVFPLDKNDFIRTRLTHSLEVSTIAEQLGIMINQDNDNRYYYHRHDCGPDAHGCAIVCLS